ncbi:hypothetical protein BGZ80_009649, partial [Entomortierella chlamydospora]
MPPSATKFELEQDYIKSPNLMKLSLDKQIEQFYGDGTVIGILIQCWAVQVWYLTLDHEAVYELKPIGNFEVIANHLQLGNLLTICSMK